jgi:hypothetical protein
MYKDILLTNGSSFLIRVIIKILKMLQMISGKKKKTHTYVLPFFVLYGIWIQAWLFSDFYGHSVEAGLIFLAVVFLLQVLMALACHWSVLVMALVSCS